MNQTELLRLLLEQEAEHALLLLDTAGRIVGWHCAAQRMFGYRAAEMLGQPIHRLFTQEDIARGEPELELANARDSRKAEDDRWHLRKDGLRIWVSGIMTGLRDEHGRHAGYSKMLRDRTDLRGHMDAIENRLTVATEENKHRQTLLATLAHELRNPLGPLANASMAIELAAPDNEHVQSSVRIIRRQTRFLDQLLCDLLNITRVDVGKTIPHFEAIDLAEVIEAALETCGAALQERQQHVEVALPNDFSVEGDRVRLQQVVVNLVSNASKFSLPGKTIWIKGTIDGDHAVFRVIDDGAGIPAEALPGIFELFTQAGPVDSDNPRQGLGLGLALVKSYVQMHRGTVQARSEGVGKGAEVIVRLSLIQPDVGR